MSPFSHKQTFKCFRGKNRYLTRLGVGRDGHFFVEVGTSKTSAGAIADDSYSITYIWYK
jgi:hypothetical protein